MAAVRIAPQRCWQSRRETTARPRSREQRCAAQPSAPTSAYCGGYEMLSEATWLRTGAMRSDCEGLSRQQRVVCALTSSAHLRGSSSSEQVARYDEPEPTTIGEA